MAIAPQPAAIVSLLKSISGMVEARLYPPDRVPSIMQCRFWAWANKVDFTNRWLK